MKKFALLFALIPSFAYASDDAFECGKKDGVLECKAKKDGVSVNSVDVNGGECAPDAKMSHKAMKKGDKFKLSNSDDCLYVRMITIKTHDGKKQTVKAL